LKTTEGRRQVTIPEFVDAGLGHSSYLIDLGDGPAAVVDPPRFPNQHGVAAHPTLLDVRQTSTVLDGGPDTWASVTGKSLETGA
jgi:hypothetical protein